LRGYGLSNVEDAVKDHNGSIQIINAHDNGKRVVIFKISITSQIGSALHITGK
jgi:sensor histidine kinase regulating citrate/malate metabolism